MSAAAKQTISAQSFEHARPRLYGERGERGRTLRKNLVSSVGNGAAAGLRDAFHSRRDRIPSVGKKVVMVRVAKVKGGQRRLCRGFYCSIFLCGRICAAGRARGAMGDKRKGRRVCKQKRSAIGCLSRGGQGFIASRPSAGKDDG